jgi:hypothetical protein
MPYVTKNKEIELLRKNVKDLQGQLQNAYVRIKKLNEALHFEKASNNPDHPFSTATGWANLEHWDSENPDASHIEGNKNEKKKD